MYKVVQKHVTQCFARLKRLAHFTTTTAHQPPRLTIYRLARATSPIVLPFISLYLYSLMLGKRARSPSSANHSAASPNHTRPTKRLARSIQSTAPYAETDAFSIENFCRCAYSIKVPRDPLPSARIRKRRAYSLNAVTPPRLRCLSPHTL